MKEGDPSSPVSRGRRGHAGAVPGKARPKPLPRGARRPGAAPHGQKGATPASPNGRDNARSARQGAGADVFLLPREPHESARLWCYRVLLHNILHLRLPPGASVVESELRTLLGVSRTPLREALMQLAQERFVYILPQKGTYVSRINMSQVLEMRFIRCCAETVATREAAARITDEQLAELNLHLERQKTAAAAHDVEAFIESDDAMHRVIYLAAGRAGVWEFFRKTNLHHFRSRILGLRLGRTLARLVNEHAALVGALRRRDPERAGDAARQHLSESSWNADSVQEKYPEYIEPPE